MASSVAISPSKHPANPVVLASRLANPQSSSSGQAAMSSGKSFTMKRAGLITQGKFAALNSIKLYSAYCFSILAASMASAMASASPVISRGCLATICGNALP